MTANDIRNICLLGHGGSGKTTLAEQMLFMTKGTDRLGRTADGNTVCDYDAEEIKRQISISLAFAPVKYKDVRINVMDAPGNFDFSGEAVSAIRAAECAVLVGAAKDGLSVGMERSWKLLGKKPRMIFVNRTDEDNSDYQACLDALKGKFGQSVVPIVAPVIDGNKKVTGIVDLLHNTAYEVKGGNIPKEFIPSVQKGFEAAMANGALAGYTMDSMKVTLKDGSFHPVDSDQLSFEIAARNGYRHAAPKAGSVILEPIMSVEVLTPEESMGDIIGDLNKRRGQIQGMESKGNARVVKAKVPLSEMFGYVTVLRTISSGRATSSMEFSHFEEVPANLAKEIIEKSGHKNKDIE